MRGWLQPKWRRTARASTSRVDFAVSRTGQNSAQRSYSGAAGPRRIVSGALRQTIPLDLGAITSLLNVRCAGDRQPVGQAPGGPKSFKP